MTSQVQHGTCDHCGTNVRAFLYFSMKAGELSYCGSCGTRYEGAILEQGGRVTLDLRHMITA